MSATSTSSPESTPPLQAPGSASNEPSERRERRRLRTRTEVALAAIRLASERGYDHVTVDDIAAEVDMAPRTFFRYFATKDEVLFTDQSAKMDRLRSAIADRPPGEPILRSVREALMSLACTFEEDRELTLAKAKLITATPSLAAKSTQRQREYHRLIAEAVAARLGVSPGTDLRAEVLAGSAVAALQAAYTVWITGSGTEHLPDLVSGALDVLDGGLAVEAVRP